MREELSDKLLSCWGQEGWFESASAKLNAPASPTLGITRCNSSSWVKDCRSKLLRRESWRSWPLANATCGTAAGGEHAPACHWQRSGRSPVPLTCQRNKQHEEEHCDSTSVRGEGARRRKESSDDDDNQHSRGAVVPERHGESSWEGIHKLREHEDTEQSQASSREHVEGEKGNDEDDVYSGRCVVQDVASLKRRLRLELCGKCSAAAPATAWLPLTKYVAANSPTEAMSSTTAAETRRSVDHPGNSPASRRRTETTAMSTTRVPAN